MDAMPSKVIAAIVIVMLAALFYVARMVARGIRNTRVTYSSSSRSRVNESWWVSDAPSGRSQDWEMPKMPKMPKMTGWPFDGEPGWLDDVSTASQVIYDNGRGGQERTHFIDINAKGDLEIRRMSGADGVSVIGGSSSVSSRSINGTKTTKIRTAAGKGGVSQVATGNSTVVGRAVVINGARLEPRSGCVLVVIPANAQLRTVKCTGRRFGDE